MRNITWLALLLTILPAGCSSDGLKRSVYSTMQNMERGRCNTTTNATPCEQVGYDEYQQQRKELQQNP